VSTFVELEDTYLRVQLLVNANELVEGEALGSSQQLAAEFHRHSFLQGIQLSMLVPAEFGDQHLELDKVGSELLLALLQTEKLGGGGRSRIGVAKYGFEDADNVVGVIQLKCSVLDDWEYLCLCPAFQAIEGITHPQGGRREMGGVTEQLDV